MLKGKRNTTYFAPKTMILKLTALDMMICEAEIFCFSSGGEGEGYCVDGWTTLWLQPCEHKYTLM